MLNLDEEQQMLVDSLSELAEQEFADDAFTWEGEVPWENLRTLADAGFLGINHDEEYGGGGMSEFEAMLTIETVGRVCPDTAYTLVSQQMVGPRGIDMFGTEAAKERYLPPVCDGEEMIAVAISEPEAGSDVKSMNSTITEEDGELILNGEKIWVTEVPDATAAVTWAKFPEGLGAVILDLDAPGVEIAQHYTNMAGGTQTQFYMNDVVIPEENVLVRGEDAFREQLKALNWERLGGAVISNTIALCALDRALDYAGQRVQFGQPIGDFQGIEWKLAEMAKQVDLSRMYTFQSARAAEQRGRVPDPLQTSIAKLYAGEMVEEVVSEALQIHGANGYQQGHPLEYLYRFARGRSIAGGTLEIQRNLIASQLEDGGVPGLGGR